MRTHCLAMLPRCHNNPLHDDATLLLLLPQIPYLKPAAVREQISRGCWVTSLTKHGETKGGIA